ncbi:helix-turn-helix transcriptional regulator [Liquorilactobacillus satsumensis]|uniref:helix-turn-helix transcriptional regulator n=1 Tax=Liquorilactobacillus TaxID=2767888 RepID=UPI001E2983F6|nr:YafY family protein [Liquorilactobacillus satsumensis]MCC7667701.1 transcriptional regulator [Liquorilactobacillus satsumensis]MCP9358785.1 YafY family transcriptional regulator [Liquorilactobacillus satsumensis]MCP9372723.1 YafY family transcriptional regulator [Liquorilactobacillus satsumensis]
MKVNRLVSIIMTLIDKERISAKGLAEMFEVSKRTIYRDIEAINMAGIPIRSTSGVGGGFEIMEAYKIDKKVFSESDITTLLIGISTIPNIIKNKDYANTLAKLQSFIPVEKLETTNLQTEQISIDFSHWIENRNLEPYLNIIKIALQENKLLSFEYINHKGNRTKRQVEPYSLVLKSSQWYLQSYCLKRKDFRLFKLTRLSNLEMEEINFVPQKYKQPFLNTPKTLSKLQTTTKLRIHESIMERLLDYCAWDKFLPAGDNYYIVNFPFIENEYYYGILLSFGERCECLEPLHVRLELKRRIGRLAKLYNNNI